MSKKLLPTVIALTLLLANCGQPGASSTPAPPDTPVQVDLFRLVPPGFVAASYWDLKSVREDPDLTSVLEPIFGGGLHSGPFKVDASMTVIWPPSKEAGSPGTIPILTIRRFDREAIAGQPEDSDFAGDLPQVTHQDYLGVELSVSETEKGSRVASASIDEATTVFGEETGVKAILDVAKGVTTPPLADLRAALPPVIYAVVRSACDYENQGCMAKVDVSLAKGPEGTIAVIQLYQFENAEMAVDALPAIRTEQEQGGKTHVGSVPIVGDTITQEGCFVKVEGVLPIEDLSRMFSNAPSQLGYCQVERGRSR